MSLFGELKRRNVFRVGIAYVVTAWAVSQVAELAVDSFEAPAWVMKMFITLLALGLPFALIFAWAFELTPDGIKKEKDVDRTRSITHSTGRRLDFAIIAILLVALSFFAWDKFVLAPGVNGSGISTYEPIPPGHEQLAGGLADEDSASAETPSQKSIAILPFSNRSSGQENTRFLSDGIHDDLLTNLAKIHELKVISRTSVMAYRDTTKNMREIGEELGVANLLEGGVQQAGERVRINVQLINALTDEHLWGETYDRDVSTENIFDIQGEIARAIARALEATLSPEENEKLGKIPTADFDAYQALLQSRQLARRGGFDALPEAVTYARKAIELDPAYVDAYLALAFALIQSITSGVLTDEQTGTEISAAIESAMALKPDYDEVWSTLGHYQATTGKPGAGESFDKAMQLNPGNAQTMYAWANMLQVRGKPQQALPLLLRASELDPFSITVLFTLGRTYDGLERYEEARETFARIRKIDPASPLGYSPASGTYYVQGQFDQALYWLSQAQSIDPQDFELGGWMVFFYDCLEDFTAASEWSDWLDSWVTKQPQPMAMQARHHYLTGNFETAVQYSNLALNLGLPDRWGSDAVFMRIKRDEALANGDPEAGIEVFRSHHPRLFQAQPDITAENLLQAVDLALLLRMSGENEEMQRLLEAAIDFYNQPFSVTGSVRASLVPARAEALAIMDNGAAAMLELRRIIDNGWRLDWRLETDLNPNFIGISETSEFRAMISELEADMAEQRASARAMVARGEIKDVN